MIGWIYKNETWLALILTDVKAIALQLLCNCFFVTSNLERLGLGRTWTVNLTAYHLDSDLFKAIRGCTYKIRSHKLRRKWFLTLCFLQKNSFIEKGMEKHGEMGEHSICRRLSTLHRLTRQQRSSWSFHGIIYESTPCSWNSEKIHLFPWISLATLVKFSRNFVNFFPNSTHMELISS